MNARWAAHNKLFKAEMHYQGASQPASQPASLSIYKVSKCFRVELKHLIYIVFFPRRLKMLSTEFNLLFAMFYFLTSEYVTSFRSCAVVACRETVYCRGGDGYLADLLGSLTLMWGENLIGLAVWIRLKGSLYDWVNGWRRGEKMYYLSVLWVLTQDFEVPRLAEWIVKSYIVVCEWLSRLWRVGGKIK